LTTWGEWVKFVNLNKGREVKPNEEDHRSVHGNGICSDPRRSIRGGEGSSTGSTGSSACGGT
jgi:hypothetical protein